MIKQLKKSVNNVRFKIVQGFRGWLSRKLNKEMVGHFIDGEGEILLPLKQPSSQISTNCGLSLPTGCRER